MKRYLVFAEVLIFLFSGIAYAGFESDVITLVNIERDAYGLHPLRFDPDLTAAARNHSEDMGEQDYFSHTSLDGREFYERITDAGYDYSFCGENIAAGYTSPASVVNGWMESPGHRANILSETFCDIGVGYAYVAGSEYGHYWTQDFGRKAGVGECPGTVEYVITASAGPWGNISPAGDVTVNGGNSQTFVITPDDTYSVEDVLVDGTSQGILLTYTFSNVNRNHTIEVRFASNNAAPAADAGPDQSVEEGETITLDGAQSSDPNDAIVVYTWNQTGGPAVTLSDSHAVRPTFVATPTMVGTVLAFQLTVQDSGGSSDTDTVQITINDNGISSYSDDVISFYSGTNKEMGIKVDGGGILTRLTSMDPESDPTVNRTGMPTDLTYGLIDFEIKVSNPGGSVTVTVFLSEPVSVDHKWYKYNDSAGWYDFSDHATFNTTRDQVSLVLVDGSTGDDDEDENGVIADPSGPGVVSSSTPATADGIGGGCFIGSAASGSLRDLSGAMVLLTTVLMGIIILRKP